MTPRTAVLGGMAVCPPGEIRQEKAQAAAFGVDASATAQKAAHVASTPGSNAVSPALS